MELAIKTLEERLAIARNNLKHYGEVLARKHEETNEFERMVIGYEAEVDQIVAAIETLKAVPAGSGMPPASAFVMTGAAAQGSAGNLSGLPAGYQSQPLSDPPFCDQCNKPRGPGHMCRLSDVNAAIDRSSALPKDR